MRRHVASAPSLSLTLSLPPSQAMPTCPVGHLVTLAAGKTSLCHPKWLLGSTQIWQLPLPTSLCQSHSQPLPLPTSLPCPVSALPPTLCLRLIEKRCLIEQDKRCGIYMRIANGNRLDFYSIYMPPEMAHCNSRQYSLCVLFRGNGLCMLYSSYS